MTHPRLQDAGLPSPATPGAEPPPDTGYHGTVFQDPVGGPPAGPPPPATARRPGLMSRAPLRITLVALLVTLVAVGLGATGITATSLLRNYLVGRQDADLRSALHAAQYDRDLIRGLLDACTAPGGQRLPGSTYYACVPPGGQDPVVIQAPPSAEASLPAMPALSADIGPESGTYGAPTTVRSVNGDTRWRVISGPLPGGYTVVIGTNLARDEQALSRLILVEALAGVSVLLVLAGAAYLLVRNSLRPLREVEHTAQAIAGGDLSQRVPAGDDRTEVGRVAGAFNVMLTRIETSFRAQQVSEEQARASEERMRRFVADASHELRTPLTSIRGFAELYRQGAAREPEEVRRLMHRIEAASERMGLLVEDLLSLARLDRQRALTITPVDLAEIAGDAVHDARAVQPDRPIAFQIDESLADVPVVLGDEPRLRQVVGNLVTNALAHTPVTARVTVRVGEDRDVPDFLLLQVADEGPGMAEADAQRVFERFYRADTSRTRAAGGTGLGLAIVAALVAAHGGTVHLQTAPGQGAVFTVRLPRSGPPQPQPEPQPQPPPEPAG